MNKRMIYFIIVAILIFIVINWAYFNGWIQPVNVTQQFAQTPDETPAPYVPYIYVPSVP